jgi:hypothetical protein
LLINPFALSLVILRIDITVGMGDPSTTDVAPFGMGD